MEYKDFKESTKFFLLSSDLPDIAKPNPQMIREINKVFSLPFLYMGSALLSHNGHNKVEQWKEVLGRCIGGGVVSSRDLDWYASGMEGNQPGDYVPERKLFSMSKTPQSFIDHEWIAFEYALMFNLRGGGGLVNPWDSIELIEKVRRQGRDWHWRIKGRFAGRFESLHGQANRNNVQSLMDIARAVGITVK